MKTLSKTKEIEVGGKKITVTKLNLRKVAKVFGEVSNLKKHLSAIQGKSEMETAGMIPTIIAENLNELAGALVLASNSELTENHLIEECGIDDVAEIWEAIREVNNFEKLKKYFGGGSKKKEK